MALSLIIFDCDGVVLETVDAKTKAFARVGLLFGQEAADRLVMFHSMHGGVSRYEKFRWLFEEVLNRPASGAEIDHLAELFAEYCYDEITTCELVPGVQSVLDRWFNKVPMFVASGAPHEELNDILQRRNLSRYFSGIYGSPPGKTQLLRNILEETGIHPSNAIMIGDSSTDQIAAEAVRCHFYGRGAYFAESGHPWFHDLTQLNDHLEQLATAP